jgi:hypothetical protein
MFPVWVTTSKRWVFALRNTGLLVVVHEPGKPMPLELLRGLDVILAMDCDKSSRVVRALNAKEIRPASVKAWCPCLQDLIYAGWDCAMTQRQNEPWQ